jgi:oligopeptidase B
MSELLIDVNKLATNHSYYHLNSIKISPDNNLLCFSEDTKGRRQYTLRFLDLRTMNFLKDEIHNTDGNVVWTRDSESLFYTIKNKSLREYKIFKHKLGESKDKEVYHEEDETFYVSISKSNSEDFIIISSSSTLNVRTQIYFKRSARCRIQGLSKNEFEV